MQRVDAGPATQDLPTIAEIRAANASVNDNGYVLLTLTRPLGPYLAWIWLRLGLTPRQVNYASIVLGLVLLATAASGTPGGALFATGLCFVWQAIDVSDGTMARALAIRDNFGGFVDYSSGMLIVAFLPFCLGLGLTTASDGSLETLSAFLGMMAAPPAFVPLVLGGAIAVTALYMRLINRILEIRFGDSLSDYGDTSDGRSFAASLRWVVKNLETIGGLQAVLLFLAACVGMTAAALLAYAFFYAALFIAFAASVYRNYGHRREYRQS